MRGKNAAAALPVRDSAVGFRLMGAVFASRDHGRDQHECCAEPLKGHKSFMK